MVRYRFGQDDLLRTRFAISPLMELVGAFDVVRAPERFAVHQPFADWAAPRLAGLELDALEIAVPLDSQWHPDFVSRLARGPGGSSPVGSRVDAGAPPVVTP